MFLVCLKIHQIQLDCEFSDLKVSNSLDRVQGLPFFRAITVRNRIFLIFVLFILVAFSSCRNNPENASGKTFNSAENPEKIAVTLRSHRELAELYESYEYRWESLEEGIPPLVLKSFPPNLDQIRDLKEKKQVFFPGCFTRDSAGQPGNSTSERNPPAVICQKGSRRDLIRR